MVLEVLPEVVLSSVDMVDSGLVKPLNALPLLPHTVLGYILDSVCKSTNTVLFTLRPPAVILAGLRPLIKSEAIFLIVLIFSFVSDPTRVEVDSMSVHEALLPRSVVLTAVSPDVSAVAIHFVLGPVTFVARPIDPHVVSPAVLFGRYVVSLEVRPIRECFYT